MCTVCIPCPLHEAVAVVADSEDVRGQFTDFFLPENMTICEYCHLNQSGEQYHVNLSLFPRTKCCTSILKILLPMFLLNSYISCMNCYDRCDCCTNVQMLSVRIALTDFVYMTDDAIAKLHVTKSLVIYSGKWWKI